MSARPEFTITRTLAAPRAVVWRLWTDPTELARWLHAGGMNTPADSVHVDLRVGGTYEYTMVNDETGEKIVSGGRYLELVEPERLVFTWGTPGDDAAPVATVVLDDLGERTALTFRLQGVEGHPGDGFFYDGWVQALDGLLAVAG